MFSFLNPFKKKSKSSECSNRLHRNTPRSRLKDPQVHQKSIIISLLEERGIPYNKKDDIYILMKKLEG